jgi:hypothetical protein
MPFCLIQLIVCNAVRAAQCTSPQNASIIANVHAVVLLLSQVKHAGSHSA